MTPVPKAFKAWRASTYLSVLIEEPFAAIFRYHPDVDEVISIPRSCSPVERFRWIAYVRRKRFDLVFNMHSGSTAGLFTVLSGAPLRVAYASARYAAACNVRIPKSGTLWNTERVHTVEHQLSPLRFLGIPVPREIRLEVGLAAPAQQRVQDQMEALAIHPGQFILMHPFATLFTKEWELSRFAELSRRLCEIYRVPVVAAAGASERERLRRLASMAYGVIITLPPLSLEELTAWIDRCGLYIGNDSGPTHLAAARKKKLVVLWGSSDFSVWHPWATEYQVLRANLPCMPCPGYRCYRFDTPRCIESISVDHVLRAVERLRPFN